MSSWTRRGLFYEHTRDIYKLNPITGERHRIGSVTKKLDLISYYLIKWHHGEAKLEQMANTTIYGE